MALKQITLTLADRLIVQMLIERPGTKIDVAVARKVREMRRRLDARQTEKQSNKWNIKLQEFGIAFSTWDNLMDGAELLIEIEEALDKEEVDDEKDKLLKILEQLKKFMEPQEFTLDNSYLAWLQELLQARDWSKMHRRQQDGSVKQVEADVHPSQMEAIVEFADMLGPIITGPSISEEREKENERVASTETK